MHLTALDEAEIIPGKDSDTRIKKKAVGFLPFHFRNRRVTTVLLLKPPFGGFRSETAIWTPKCYFLKSVRNPRKL
jgi:hypothetical protein